MLDSAAVDMPAMVQGASRGIGLELTRQLLARGRNVFATCRRPNEAEQLAELSRTADRHLKIVRLDVLEEATIADAARQVPTLSLLINAAGLLHDEPMMPERKLDHVDANHLQRVFATNAFGPLLVAKHFAGALAHGGRAVLANISARVGSIGDNRLGGWYAYRASKAAQNMITRNLAIELRRRSRELTVVGLHPGTVDTDLSKPFQRGVPADKLFDVARAARQLLNVIDALRPSDNGKFLAYDGQPIPW